MNRALNFVGWEINISTEGWRAILILIWGLDQSDLPSLNCWVVTEGADQRCLAEGQKGTKTKEINMAFPKLAQVSIKKKLTLKFYCHLPLHLGQVGT